MMNTIKMMGMHWMGWGAALQLLSLKLYLKYLTCRFELYHRSHYLFGFSSLAKRIKLRIVDHAFLRKTNEQACAYTTE